MVIQVKLIKKIELQLNFVCNSINRSLTDGGERFMFQCISNLINPLAQQIDRATRTRTVPAELVEACAPYLSAFNEQLGAQQSELVELLRWPNEGDAAYARQRIAEAPDQSWSLYAITWLPGQYTPIHDHGTWGVVTVLQATTINLHCCSIKASVSSLARFNMASLDFSP